VGRLFLLGDLFNFMGDVMKHKHYDVIVAWAEEYIFYNKDEGKLYWKKQPKGRGKIGNECGRIVRGYRRIGMMNEEIQSHIFIWILEHNAFPDKSLDHIDGNPQNNRIDNLRLVTSQQNQHNQTRAHKSNSSGLIGAHKDNIRGGYQSKIYVNNKAIFLGRCETAQEAHKKYLEAKVIYHPSAPYTGELKSAEVL